MVRLFFFCWITALSLRGFGIEASCSQSPLLGSWIDLSTLNTFELTSDCAFKWDQGKCNHQGVLKSNTLGTVFDFKSSLPLSTCQGLEKRACSFKSLSNLLTFHCKPDIPQHYVRADLNFLKKTNLSVHIKTLKLLKQNSTRKLEKHLERLSDQGYGEALAARGYLYLLELHGFPQNYSLALDLNQKAAQKNYLASQTLVGTQYLYGLGTEASFKKAERAFEKSAHQGDVIAQKALAGMYLAHENREKYQPLAFEWLEKAGNLGDEQARTYLQAIRGPTEELKDRSPSLAQNTELNTRSETSQDQKLSFLYQVTPQVISSSGNGMQGGLGVGISPILPQGEWAIRGQLQLSILNLLGTDQLSSLETSVYGRYLMGNTFFEGGLGLDFLLNRGETAPIVSLSYGKKLTSTIFSGISMDSFSVGLAKAFFSRDIYKLFLGIYF